MAGPNPAIWRGGGGSLGPIKLRRGREAWPDSNWAVWGEAHMPSPDLAMQDLGIWQRGRNGSINTPTPTTFPNPREAPWAGCYGSMGWS